MERAIRVRWALRDIKAKRTKVTPVSPDDLQTLIELGVVAIGRNVEATLIRPRPLPGRLADTRDFKACRSTFLLTF